jgi:hypothetical protein
MANVHVFGSGWLVVSFEEGLIQVFGSCLIT